MYPLSMKINKLQLPFALHCCQYVNTLVRHFFPTLGLLLVMIEVDARVVTGIVVEADTNPVYMSRLTVT